MESGEEWRWGSEGVSSISQARREVESGEEWRWGSEGVPSISQAGREVESGDGGVRVCPLYPRLGCWYQNAAEL